MSDNLEQSLDALQVASVLIGQTRSVTFNSKIYEHSLNDKLNPDKDIFILRATKEDPVTLKNIIRLFERMQKQFRLVKKYEPDRSYFYEGIQFDSTEEMYVVIWGS